MNQLFNKKYIIGAIFVLSLLLPSLKTEAYTLNTVIENNQQLVVPFVLNTSLVQTQTISPVGVPNDAVTNNPAPKVDLSITGVLTPGDVFNWDFNKLNSGIQTDTYQNALNDSAITINGVDTIYGSYNYYTPGNPCCNKSTVTSKVEIQNGSGNVISTTNNILSTAGTPIKITGVDNLSPGAYTAVVTTKVSVRVQNAICESKWHYNSILGVYDCGFLGLGTVKYLYPVHDFTLVQPILFTISLDPNSTIKMSPTVIVKANGKIISTEVFSGELVKIDWIASNFDFDPVCTASNGQVGGKTGIFYDNPKTPTSYSVKCTDIQGAINTNDITSMSCARSTADEYLLSKNGGTTFSLVKGQQSSVWIYYKADAYGVVGASSPMPGYVTTDSTGKITNISDQNGKDYTTGQIGKIIPGGTDLNTSVNSLLSNINNQIMFYSPSACTYPMYANGALRVNSTQQRYWIYGLSTSPDNGYISTDANGNMFGITGTMDSHPSPANITGLVEYESGNLQTDLSNTYPNGHLNAITLHP